MNSKLLVGGAILFALLFFSLFYIRIPVIAIETDVKTFFVKDKPVTLSWIHSVEKEPWHEVYERQGDALVLTETSFKAYGAGVPSDLEIIEQKDGFVRMKVDRKMKDMHVIVSENVETTITVVDRKVALYKMLEPYSEVTFEIKRLHIWHVFGGEFL